jgi:hypothetical protein
MKPVLLIAAVWLSLTQQPRPDGPGAAAQVGTASIAGAVRDDAGRAVPRATVTIAGAGLELAAITGDDGAFTFSDLPAGRFTIKAEKPAYPSVSYGAKRPNRPGPGVLLDAGREVTGILLTLARGAVLTGTVFDDRGQPMPGVSVMAWEVRAALGGARTLDFPSTGGVSVTTDDRGRYRVYGLPPGEYTVGTAWFYSGLAEVRVPTEAELRAAFQAIAQPGSRAAPVPAVAPTSYNYARVFFPDSLDPMLAGTVTVASNDVRDGLDIRMQFRPMAQIRGRVVGAVDGAQGGIRMTLTRRSPVQALNTTTVFPASPDGAFSTQSLAPGDYTIMAQTNPTPTSTPMWAKADVTISSADPVDVVLRVEPAVALTGRLAFEGAGPPPDPTRARITLVGTDMASFAANSGPAVVDASGAFTLGGVVPGRYRFNVNMPSASAGAPPAWTLRDVRFGGTDVTDLPVDIGAGPMGPVSITLSDQIGELTGSLTDVDGRPATDYFVIVVPADSRYWVLGSRRIVNARPDIRGRFSFRGLPAGDYRIAATTDLVPRDLQDTTSIAELMAQALPVKVLPGQTTTFDIKLNGK